MTNNKTLTVVDTDTTGSNVCGCFGCQQCPTLFTDYAVDSEGQSYTLTSMSPSGLVIGQIVSSEYWDKED